MEGGSASSTRRWSTRPAWARTSSWVRRRGGSRRSRHHRCWSRRRQASRARSRSGRRTRRTRPVELGGARGKMVRELRAATPEAAATRLRERAGFDDRAIKNLLAYLDDQAAATGAVPDDRNVVVERFGAEVGDWRG